MVLARMEDDPPGARGLSLFIVPRFLADESGRLTKRNDVACQGIERKTELHGLVTRTMAFGREGVCTGRLLGRRGRGIVEMFSMMNDQRLLLGLQGLFYSSAAFSRAVDKAAERKRGASVQPGAALESASAPNIEHPDIKRMLLTMKATQAVARKMVAGVHLSDGGTVAQIANPIKFSATPPR